MPGLVSISTHISRAYFLGRVAKVGDSFLGVSPEAPWSCQLPPVSQLEPSVLPPASYRSR